MGQDPPEHAQLSNGKKTKTPHCLIIHTEPTALSQIHLASNIPPWFSFLLRLPYIFNQAQVLSAKAEWNCATHFQKDISITGIKFYCGKRFHSRSLIPCAEATEGFRHHFSLVCYSYNCTSVFYLALLPSLYPYLSPHKGLTRQWHFQ